ncbi:MAG: LacI family DNA-binding transcriptional regulator [Anaerolineae bacterium]|nr:LacI family DNA-binding transcriptional regulator [Anaerolineae bacterium]
MSSVSKSDNKKVTLANVAQDSGVSLATVSLVLRDKPGVSEETRQRVLDSAKTLGYIYTPSNQALSRSIPNQIGLIIKSRPDDIPATNSFYASVMAGIEMICRRSQINLMYANLLVDENNNPLEMPRLMTRQEVDGLLIVGMHLDSQMVAGIKDLGMPVVLVDAYADGDPFDAVVTDNFMGGYRVTEYLIQQGHHHIAIVGSQPQSYPSIQERRDGYLRALNDYDLTPAFGDCPLHPSAVKPCVESLLEEHPEVTAIFGSNDDVAIAAMQAAQSFGKHPPEDLAVVGFDNIHLAHLVTPRLSTMRVDMVEMGRLAVYLLMNRIEFPEAGRVRTVICPHLIERDSGLPV